MNIKEITEAVIPMLPYAYALLILWAIVLFDMKSIYGWSAFLVALIAVLFFSQSIFIEGVFYLLISITMLGLFLYSEYAKREASLNGRR